MRRAGAILAATALLAGCGGSGRLSSSQLHTRATAICALATVQMGRIPTPASPTGGGDFLRRGLAILDPEIVQLRRLEPPDDVADVYGTAIRALDQKLTAMKRAVHDLDHGGDPTSEMTTLAQHLAPIQASENGAWRALEVPACVDS